MYRVFRRRWWKENKACPNGLAPDAGRIKEIIAEVPTAREAREICNKFNTGPRTDMDRRLGVRCEFEEGR